MRKLKIIVSFLVLIFCMGAVSGQKIIAPKELKKVLNSKDVVIVSTRKTDDYKKVHIPNAVNIYPNDLYKAGDIKGLIKTPDELANIFSKKGISENKTIIIYDNDKNIAAGRLFWIFDYLGCKNVKILDGQLPAWRQNRLPLTKEPTAIKPATFTPSPDKNKIVTTKYITEHLKDPNVIIVDTRSKDEFDGVKGEVSRKGHIPGAVHFEYKNVVKENNTIKSAEELTTLFKNAGITSDKEVILYCETSARAGIVYLTLKYILEYPNVKVYDGALYEWAADAANPME